MDKTKILLDGLHVSFDGRSLFMKEIFRYPELRKEVMEKLLKEGELRDWVSEQTATVGGGCFVQLKFNEDDMITLFEKMTKGGSEIRKLKPENPVKQYYYNKLGGKENKLKADVDGVLLLTYGIVNEKKCREKLKILFTEPERYYAKFEESNYKDCRIFDCISAEYFWEARLLIGILQELRETRDSDMFQKVLQVIYAGYATLKKDIKKYSYMTGDMLKEIHANSKNNKKDAMIMNAQILISFIIMEELGTEILWDFTMGILLPFLEHFEQELELGSEVNGVGEEIEKKQAEWRHKFQETYGSELCIRKLLLEQEGDENANALTSVMALFHMNPRKFQGYELTEEEHRLVTAQKESWNSKIYWGVLVVAQLCKYIQELEKRLSIESLQFRTTKEWLDQEKRQSDFKESTELIKQNEVLKRKIKNLEQTLMEHFQTEKKLEKQIQISESKFRESQEKIANLKEYIYYSTEEIQEEYEEDDKSDCTICWEKKQVLVLGGHPSWQNKLRTIYPMWQFLVSEQRSLISEAVKGKEYIICNTQMLSHACYYKLLSCMEEGQKILYIRHTNIEKGIHDLEKQFRARSD